MTLYAAFDFISSNNKNIFELRFGQGAKGNGRVTLLDIAQIFSWSG
jgi:hypothetical protein